MTTLYNVHWTSEVMESSEETFSEEHNSLLVELISSISANGESAEVVQQVKAALPYLKTYNVERAEQHIIKHVMTVINKNFEKIFEENKTLLETADDDFISVLIKANIKLSIELTEIADFILKFILQNSNINLVFIESIIKSIPYYVQLFCHHFQTCHASYRDSFEKDIASLLEVIQILYSHFLEILESCVYITDNHGAILLSSTLIVLCKLTEILSDININLLVMTFKNLVSMSEKYSNHLENVMDLIVPIDCITAEIQKRSVYLLEHDESFCYQIKYLDFLFKIVMKLCENFSRSFNEMSLGIACFFIKTLNFSLDFYKSSNLPNEAVQLIEQILCVTLEQFLHQILLIHDMFKTQLQKIFHISDLNIVCKKYPMGLLSFLNMNLKISVLDYNIPPEFTSNMISLIFSALNQCYKDLFYKSYKEGIFSSLVINISAAILIRGNIGNVEILLLNNLVQENPFVSLLVLDIYTLVLRNISINDLKNTLVFLLSSVKMMNFGVFTHRPESIYFKELLIRIFSMLPITSKVEIIDTIKPETNLQIGYFMGVRNFLSFKKVLGNIVEPGIFGIEEQSVNQEGFLHAVQNLSLLCTTDLRNNTIDPIQLAFAIGKLWEFDSSVERLVLTNHASRSFIRVLINCTAVYWKYFSQSQLKIINQLKVLSALEEYKVSILETFEKVSVDSILSNIVFAGDFVKVNQELLNSGSVLLREMTLDMLFQRFSTRRSVLENIFKSFSEKSMVDIQCYFQQIPNDTVNYEGITRASYGHVCLTWYNNPRCKLFNAQHYNVTLSDRNGIDTFPDRPKFHYSLSNRTCVSTFKHMSKEDIVEVEDCEADDTIQRLKSDVKCLSKIVKTEKLTPKNVADLKIVLSRLSSLI
ncbi:uncharacterized protein LOC132703393 isoform X2 [Cylas formicarius]|uniref:uncharacterized protein LOC132703393 isoform X2 n=1 Tax=Cylas formicarius TaxID=197179 RepID=UPI0029586BE1|nr:uncharacterized protein LOC132703393 isoform X2 [Cylas formicarius]